MLVTKGEYHETHVAHEGLSIPLTLKMPSKREALRALAELETAANDGKAPSQGAVETLRCVVLTRYRG